MNNLNKYDRRDKRWIRLNREYEGISLEVRMQNWVPVDKPYQDGWFISIELREEAKRRDDAPALQTALNLVMHKSYTKSPKLVSTIRKCKSIRDAYKLFSPTGAQRTQNFREKYSKDFVHVNKGWAHASSPYLGAIRKETYKTLAPNIKKLFYETTPRALDLKYWWFKDNPYKCHLPDYLLEMRVRPAMVTHIQDIDSRLVKRYNEVRDELQDYWRHCERYGRAGWENYFGRRAHRAAERGAMQKFLKAETEDFELKQRIRNYD